VADVGDAIAASDKANQHAAGQIIIDSPEVWPTGRPAAAQAQVDARWIILLAAERSNGHRSRYLRICRVHQIYDFGALRLPWSVLYFLLPGHCP
jgi:hypothetical protein